MPTSQRKRKESATGKALDCTRPLTQKTIGFWRKETRASSGSVPWVPRMSWYFADTDRVPLRTLVSIPNCARMIDFWPTRVPGLSSPMEEALAAAVNLTEPESPSHMAFYPAGLVEFGEKGSQGCRVGISRRRRGGTGMSLPACPLPLGMLPPGSRPENVGILAMEVYFPTRYVSQSKLEQCDGCPGKYTRGLGQVGLAFCDDREDITSIMLNVVKALLDKYHIDPASIGRLEVGTETLIDKSKSTKTCIMELLGRYVGANTDVEGVTSINACYGGTAALFNSVAWVESSAWDGRYALVVCGDIAVYEAGPARATSGCGAVAMLIGPDAPLVLEPGRCSHAMDVYDFYKPKGASEYPIVDGKLSQKAYLKSLDACFRGYQRKQQQQQMAHKAAALLSSPSKPPHHHQPAAAVGAAGSPSLLPHEHPPHQHLLLPSSSLSVDPPHCHVAASSSSLVSLDSFDYFCFHSPYHKLAQKGLTRLVYLDFIDHPTRPQYQDVQHLLPPPPHHRSSSDLQEEEATSPPNEDREIDAAFRDKAEPVYQHKLLPTARLTKQIGNCYSASIFMGLASLVHDVASDLAGKRVLLFSYGSGSMASLYTISGRKTASGCFTLFRMSEALNLNQRLAQRTQCSPAHFEHALSLRERRVGCRDYEPSGDVEHVAQGDYYLAAVDAAYRRHYSVR